ncbi:signal recognition particle protein, partial [Candidatus Sumerlaeota bacterium]|nr:signal recognition particle protein [Candidatus Sumerlaeota bacterium]
SFGRQAGPGNTTIRWNGMGIAAPVGTAVRAVAAGTVRFATQFGTYGLCVFLDHNGGYYSIYCQLQSADVRPGQQIVKIVHDELVEMLGGTTAEFALQSGGTQIILLLGLQGSGKTTFAGKLSKFLMKHGFKPLLVACDIYRPAAIEQLHVVGRGVGVPVFDMGTQTPAPEIARQGIEAAKAKGCDLVIIDTAGRLHIDEVKMDELVELKNQVKPNYTFLVADAMTGQDAVNSASAFHAGVGIDGVCLTKIDGDARGGAALSIRAVTQKPIFFIGTGEKADDLEPFYPDRIASRILGMGDVVSLVEKAQETIDVKEAMELQKKMRRAQFTLQDFHDQVQKLKKMGPLTSLMKMIPGMGQMMKDMPIDDDAFVPMEAMIRSMTPQERENPDILDGSRRKRIAKGSGRTPQEVNEMLREFEQMRQMMSKMMQMGMGGGGDPGGKPISAASQAVHNANRGGNPMLIKNKPKHRRKRKTKKGR